MAGSYKSRARPLPTGTWDVRIVMSRVERVAGIKSALDSREAGEVNRNALHCEIGKPGSFPLVLHFRFLWLCNPSVHFALKTYHHEHLAQQAWLA